MSTTTLKLIALVTMLIDHIGFFIPNTPEWLRYIGRLSAPIFLFCAVIGYTNTKDKKKYLIRIYTFSVFMGFIDAFILLNINYIRTIFMTIMIIFLIDCYKNHNPYAKKYIFTFILWEIIIGFLCTLCYTMEEIPTLPTNIEIIIIPLFIVPLFLNYGFPFVLLGICMYFADSKKKLSISYIVITLSIMFFQNTDFLHRVSLKISRIAITTNNDLLKEVQTMFEFFSNGFLDIEVRFLENNLWYTAQWLMIFSLPLLLLYNGKKGKGLKYFFYIMYPLNIVLFYYIGVSMGNTF